jgi:hypothetical protein
MRARAAVFIATAIAAINASPASSRAARLQAIIDPGL